MKKHRAKVEENPARKPGAETQPFLKRLKRTDIALIAVIAICLILITSRVVMNRDAKSSGPVADSNASQNPNVPRATPRPRGWKFNPSFVTKDQLNQILKSKNLELAKISVNETPFCRKTNGETSPTYLTVWPEVIEALRNKAVNVFIGGSPRCYKQGQTVNVVLFSQNNPEARIAENVGTVVYKQILRFDFDLMPEELVEASGWTWRARSSHVQPVNSETAMETISILEDFKPASPKVSAPRLLPGAITLNSAQFAQLQSERPDLVIFDVRDVADSASGLSEEAIRKKRNFKIPISPENLAKSWALQVRDIHISKIPIDASLLFQVLPSGENHHVVMIGKDFDDIRPYLLGIELLKLRRGAVLYWYPLANKPD